MPSLTVHGVVVLLASRSDYSRWALSCKALASVPCLARVFPHPRTFRTLAALLLLLMLGTDRIFIYPGGRGSALEQGGMLDSRLSSLLCFPHDLGVLALVHEWRVH